MAFKPNYNQQRAERDRANQEIGAAFPDLLIREGDAAAGGDRAKRAKREEKLRQQAERTAQRKGEGAEGEDAGPATEPPAEGKS